MKSCRVPPADLEVALDGACHTWLGERHCLLGLRSGQLLLLAMRFEGGAANRLQVPSLPRRNEH